MSENIDRRVVEMRFDNKDFEQNVNTTMTVLDKLKEKLSFKGSGEKFESASGLGSAIDGVKSRFSALEIIGTTALVNLTNSAMNLGKQMAKSLTVDQVKAGFAEYELKMGSIQTIMASTGKDIGTVNKYLSDLNTYSDKTIYSFSDMTSSIGKFTNAGVDLDTAVNAIKGISNEAAVSGANAQEASRAMYNFAQALSAGYVKLIDWKSIENANMATKEFKQQLIDTAVAEGTLEKAADGTYKVLTSGAGGGFKETITATKNFNDSLSAAWMTTDVLTKTLGKYADETTDIGKKAYAAAQDVKTFSQLMDTIKESIGSGWAQTFELIFGNLEEAKHLWTAVNEVVSGFIGRSADARNSLLQTWHDSDKGRAALLDGFHNLFNAVLSVTTPIKEAFRDIFPPMTADALINFSTNFQKLTKSMIISDATAEKINRVFTVLFSVLKMGLTVVKSVASIFLSFFKVVIPVGGTALSLMDKISQAMIGLADGAEKLSDGFQNITKGLFGKAIEGLGKLFTLLGTAISHIDLGKVAAVLAGGGILSAGMKIAKLSDTITEKLESLFGKDGEGRGGLMDGIKETLGSLSDTLNQFQTSLKVGQLVTVAIALGILAASCATLADIPVKRLAAAVAALGGLFGELAVASHFMKGAETKGIIAMSVAVVILAHAVKQMSEIADIGKGLIGVGVILGELTAFCLIFDRMKIKPRALAKTGAGLILMAVAINLLAKPIQELGALDTGSLIQGLLAMAAMLGGFTLTALAFSKIKTNGLIKAGAAMVIMATAMNILVKPLSVLGAMDLGSLARGLGAMGAALLELAGFTAIMGAIAKSSSNIMKASAALLIMSVGIKIMASALAQMGADSSGATGLGVMFGSLVILAVAMTAMQKSLGGAAAMVVAAGALMIMAPAIALLSSLDFMGVVTGLVALAGTLAVFGMATFVLEPVIPFMIALAGAMALLGVGVLSLGAGMTMLVTAFSMATGPIISGAQALAQAFPIIAQGVGDGIVAIITTIGNSIEAIKMVLLQVVSAMIAVFGTVIPQLVTIGMRLILALLSGINQNIGKITATALSILVNFINAIAANIGSVVDAGANLIVQFVQGMADSIATHGPELINAMKSLLLSLLETMVSAIPGIGKAGAKAIEKYRQSLDTGGKQAVKSAKKTSKDVGRNLKVDDKEVQKGLKGAMDGQSKALERGAKSAAKVAKSASTTTSKNLKIKDQTSNGSNAVKGIVSGMNGQIPALRSKSNEIAAIVDKTIREKNKIKSPSRVLAQTGKYLMQGLILGIDSLTGDYQNRANNIATMMISSTNSAISAIDSINTPAFTSTVTRATEVNLQMAGVEKENQKLANGISSLTKQLSSMTESMNSRALNNYITVDGSADPEAFADDLIRSFRLNARTV